MCFGLQTTDQTQTAGASNNSGVTSANSATSGNSSTGTTNAANSLSSAIGSSNQNTVGSSNTVGGNTSATNGLSTTSGVNNQATTGQTVGNTANTTANTTAAIANPAIQAAALGNLDFVRQLQANGFQGYNGQQVANIAPGQQGTIDAATGIANNGTGAQAANLIGGYASAPAQNVNANTISSAMSPYMNQYVMQALAPQLRQMEIANAKTQQATDANATGSGAFGDARTGFERSNNAFNANVAREGLIGSAYNTAFNTAIGAGAQDVSNNLSAQNANAGYNESALSRALGGAGALQNLQTQQLGTQSTANTLNQQTTAQQQAALTAQYNQWLMAQQYPFQTAGLVNSTVGQAASALPATTQQMGSATGLNLQNTLGTAIGTTGSTTANNQNTVGTNTSGTTNQSATTGNTANTTGTVSNAAGTSNTANNSNTAATGASQSQGTTSGTSATQKPNNSGLAVGGALLSAFI